MSLWAAAWPGHNLERLTGTGPLKRGLCSLHLGCQGLMSAHQDHSFHPSLPALPECWLHRHPLSTPLPLCCALRHWSQTQFTLQLHSFQAPKPSHRSEPISPTVKRVPVTLPDASCGGFSAWVGLLQAQHPAGPLWTTMSSSVNGQWQQLTGQSCTWGKHQGQDTCCLHLLREAIPMIGLPDLVTMTPNHSNRGRP